MSVGSLTFNISSAGTFVVDTLVWGFARSPLGLGAPRPGIGAENPVANPLFDVAEVFGETAEVMGSINALGVESDAAEAPAGREDEDRI